MENDTLAAIMALPVVQQIVEKNKKLKQKNKALKNLIYSLPEFRQKSSNCNCCNNHTNTNVKTDVIDLTLDDTVVIKTEPGVVDEEEVEVSVDDEEVVEVVEVSADEEEDEVEVSAEEEEVEVSADEEEDEVEVSADEEEEEEVSADEEEVEVSVDEEEEEVEVSVDEEEVEVEVSAEEEEEEEEVFEIEINSKSYYTTDEQNGIIFEITEDEDIGDEVGKFKKGKAVFSKNK